MRKYLIISAVLLMAVGLASSGHSAKGNIKIGAIFTTTGSNSPLGIPEKNTVLMIAEDINAKGGILGAKLEVVIYDDEGDNTKAATLAKKLIESDKVVGIVGPTLSGTSFTALTVADEASVPIVSCAASIKIVEPVRKWVFKTAQNDRLVIEKLYNHMKKKGLNKIAIITVNNPYGESGKAELTNLSKKYGITIVASEKFAQDDTDMTAQLTKIKANKEAKAIICWGTNPGPARIAKHVKQLGIKIPLFQSHGVANPQFLQQAEGAAEGNMLFASRLIVAEQLPAKDPSKKKLIEYKKKYESKFGTVSTFGGHAFDAFWIMIEAIKRAKAPDRAKVRNEIEKTKKFVGMTGIFTYSQKDHAGLGPDALVPIVVKGGKWTLVK